MVVFDDEAPNSEADYDEVFAPVLDLPIGCDVIPCRWSDFQEVLSPAEKAASLLDRLDRARRSFEEARSRRDFVEVNEVETEIRDVNEQLRELGDGILDRLSRADSE